MVETGHPFLWVVFSAPVFGVSSTNHSSVSSLECSASCLSPTSSPPPLFPPLSQPPPSQGVFNRIILPWLSAEWVAAE